MARNGNMETYCNISWNLQSLEQQAVCLLALIKIILAQVLYVTLYLNAVP